MVEKVFPNSKDITSDELEDSLLLENRCENVQ